MLWSRSLNFNSPDLDSEHIFGQLDEFEKSQQKNKDRRLSDFTFDFNDKKSESN